MRTQYEAVYTALGRLFHAIAACDRLVAPNEQRTLNELIKKRWLRLEESRDQYGTDAAHYISFAFDTAVEQHAPVQEGFRAFKDAMVDHPSLFNDAVKSLTWETAHGITEAMGGTSDAEQDLLARLGQLLHGKTIPA